MPNQTFKVELTRNTQMNTAQWITNASMVAPNTALALEGSAVNRAPINIAAIAAK